MAGPLGAKLLLFVVVLALSAAHDFYFGPQAARQMQRAPEAPQTERLRRRSSWLGHLTLLLSLLILALAITLPRGGL